MSATIMAAPFRGQMSFTPSRTPELEAALTEAEHLAARCKELEARLDALETARETDLAAARELGAAESRAAVEADETGRTMALTESLARIETAIADHLEMSETLAVDLAIEIADRLLDDPVTRRAAVCERASSVVTSIGNTLVLDLAISPEDFAEPPSLDIFQNANVRFDESLAAGCARIAFDAGVAEIDLRGFLRALAAELPDAEASA